MDQVVFLLTGLKVAFVAWVAANLTADAIDALRAVTASARANQEHVAATEHLDRPGTTLVAVIVPALQLGLSEHQIRAVLRHELKERQTWTK